jgi:hypothetical protein
LDTLNRRAIGNPENYPDYADGMRASILFVIWRYLNIPAISVHIFHHLWQITFLHLNILFAIASAIFLFKNRTTMEVTTLKNGQALIATTWYSIIAPLSWLIIFKPTSYTHDAIFPIVWQMPFTLLGFAVCGYVLQNLFKSHLNLLETRP